MADLEEVLQSSLADTERLIIQQEVELLEAGANAAANAVGMDGLGALGEQANKYDIFTDTGGKKFRVIETSEYCGFTGRVCCRPNHALQLHVYEEGNEIMWMDRPCKFSCGCCCGGSQCFALNEICQQEIKLYSGPSKAQGEEGDPKAMIGYIQQPFLGGLLSPQLNVMEREGSEEPFAVIQAEATCCIAGMCCDHTFTVKDPNGNYMGKIVKERPEGLGQIAKELATDADNFTLYTPKDMDVKRKATMLSALHLVDYMFFENEGDLNIDIVNQKCKCKCCDMYCCGCVVPCACNCDCSGGGGGDGGDFGGDD